MPPLVSCLMVTADRQRLARRAVACFRAQTWPDKELVVVDDGGDDYADMLAEFPGIAVRYERVRAEPGRRLGALRNVSLDIARGDYCIQWDDDEWCHPRRIEVQLAGLHGGAGASLLRRTLMHLDVPEFVDRPYRTGLRSGTPGTILHQRTAVRYPNVARGENSVFRDLLWREMRIAVLDTAESHLFIRCFHGANTWHRQHFTERLHYTWSDKLHYAYARAVKRDLFAHRAFQLSADERAATAAFLSESRALGLIAPPERFSRTP